MTSEDLAPGGDQPEITASTAAPEPEKVDDMAEGAKAPEATTEQGKQPEAAITEDAATKEASDAGKALNKRKQSYQERMNEVTHQRREAERRADRAERELAQLRKTIKAPVRDDYTDPDKLTADQVAYTMDQRDLKRLESEHSEAKAEADRAVAVAWWERKEAYSADNPDVDFDKVLATTRLSDATAMLIADMDDGPAVLVQLGKNSAELRRIEGLPERQRAFALGKIAAQITAPPPRRVTTAPPPVDAASGKSGGGPAPDAGKVDMDEYARLRKSGWRG